MTDYIAILSLLISSSITIFTIVSEYRAARAKHEIEQLGFSDELAEGARIIIELTRAELDREQEKRLKLETQLNSLKHEIEQLRIELTNAVNCSLLLYGQIVSAGLKPIAEPRRINGKGGQVG